MIALPMNIIPSAPPKRRSQPRSASRPTTAPAPTTPPPRPPAEAPPPAGLGEPADDRTRDDEADQISARGAQDDRGPALALGEERQSHVAEQDVKHNGQEPAP